MIILFAIIVVITYILSGMTTHYINGYLLLKWHYNVLKHTYKYILYFHIKNIL